MEIASGIQDGLLSKPSGGGSMQSLGERFQPDLLKGSGNYSIPIKVPKGPNDICPGLSLRYSTGLGNGVFGMGWQLAGPLFIQRRTDKGLPTYGSNDEFILAGGEVLVHVGNNQYRPRSDTQFWDIRIDGDGWVIRTKDGRKLVFGKNPESRIEKDARIYGWMVESETDPAGNTINYSYIKEENQLYLDQISWSIYSLKFVYEDRPDKIHNGRPGFALKTKKRTSRIELHCNVEAQSLVMQYELSYSQAKGTQLSLLSKVQKSGIDKNGNREEYPPVEFSYSEHNPDSSKYMKIQAEHIPPPLLGKNGTTLVDMDGDGLPDILQALRNGHRYWKNYGNGRIGEMVELKNQPVGVHLEDPGVTFTDINGDGSADLLKIGTRLNMAITNTGQGEWNTEPLMYKQQFPLMVSDSSTRFVDLNGDGVPDLLQTSPHGFTIAYNKGKKGWSDPETILRKEDLDIFPNVSLGADDIYLADITGDGLTDIVYMVSGQLLYWPNYGYGHWGGKEEMQNAPRLPRGFSRDRLFLTDLDGDGLADLIYIDHDKIYYWMNQGGTSWSSVFEIPFVPPPQISSLYLVDILGKGTRGILWCSEYAQGDDTGYRFLDLSSEIKPYLLTTIKDGFGGTSTMEYVTSTSIRKMDEASGNPWNTYLPFPLQVVNKIIEKDKNNGMVRETKLNYHKGYYDPVEKVFRGFQQVSMTRNGDKHSPAIQQVSEFFLGTFYNPGESQNNSLQTLAYEHALSGSLQKVEVYELALDGTRKLSQTAEMQWEANEEFNDDEHFVYFPRLKSTETLYHVQDDVDKVEKAIYSYDNFGNVNKKKLWSRFENQTEQEGEYTEQTITFASNVNDWLVGLPARIETRDRNGKLLTDTKYFYDGNDFVGLPSGQVNKGLLKKSSELVLTSWNMPADYEAKIEPSWGLIKESEGYYRVVEAYRHDNVGNVTAIRDPLGEIKEVEFDANQLFPVKITTSDGLTALSDFDIRTAQPLRLQTDGNVVTEYNYSALGNLIAEYNSSGDGSLQLTQYFRIQYFEETPSGIHPPAIYSVKPHHSGEDLEILKNTADLTTLTTASIEIDYYDCQGKLLQRTKNGSNNGDPANKWIHASIRRYSVNGKPGTDYPNRFSSSPEFNMTPSAGGEINFYYDLDGKATRVEHPDGGRYRVDYFNTRIEKWDAGMKSSDPPIIETYTSKGFLKKVEHPAGNGVVTTTNYDIDYAGRITNINSADGNNTTQYTFAGPSKAIRIDQQESGTRNYWYDANGQLRLREDSLGRKLSLDYDLHGRMINATDITDSNNPQVVRQFIYNGKNLERSIEGDIEINFQNDLLGRPLEKTIKYTDDQELTLKRTYGLHGEVRNMTYPDDTTIDLDYHLNGTVKSISGYVDSTQYNAHDNPVDIQFSGIPSLKFDYDTSFNRLTNISLMENSNILRSISYQYDKQGQIVKMEDQLSNETFGRKFKYDGLYRLIQSDTFQGGLSGTLIRNDQYNYNASGDIQRNDESGITSYQYGDSSHPSRLTSVNLPGSSAPSALEYDEGGRLTEFDNMQDMEYDVWDRLVSVNLKDGTHIRFKYDQYNRKVCKETTKNGVTKTERYFENFYEENEDTERINIYLGRLLIARVEKKIGNNTEKAYVMTDHLGSLVATCNEQGNLLQEQLYTPFGRALQASGTDSRYIGIPSDDELGMVQMGARFYHPLLGRFISPDWFVIENPKKVMRLPQGFNVYSYAINNPIMLRDPSGLFFGIDDLIVAAIGFVVGFFTGLIVGLADGRSFGDSLLLGLEAGLLGAAGAWLAYATMGLALAGLSALGLGISGGVVAALTITAAVIGGLNGIISGSLEIYDWSSWTGWASFFSDSTWGIVGTTIGVLLHTVNLFYGSDRSYRHDLSRRQNRHVYDGGFGFSTFAFTQGNVVSNLNGRDGDLLDHETLHITQSRIFGPIFQVTYVAWLVVGFIVALVAAPFTDQGIGQDIMDIAYLDNPWETWAYSVGGTPDGGTLSYA